MLRLFKESLTRRVSDLDGQWYYCPDPSGAAKWDGGLPEEKRPIMVPSCWNNEAGMLQYEGNVWMEAEVYTSLPNVRFVFGAVNNECDVYLDGRHLGYHHGPFTEFAFLVENVAPGKHTLVLRTNNVHDPVETIPRSSVDWFHYGGIIRSVEVHEFENAAVEAVKLSYTLEGTAAQLTAHVSLRTFAKITAPVRLLLDGEVLAEREITIDGCGEVSIPVQLDSVKLWSPEAPNLYTFTVEFAGDTLRERTGFRTIAISEGKFLLNGTPIWFKGVNRHEEHPDWGFAVPACIAKRDVDIIRNMGCNFIRGSHYPNAKSTLDYMDETGMLFWEEIPMWGFQEDSLSSQLVRSRGCYMHTQMVRRDYNHPCIVVWGLNNEVATQTQAAWEVAKLFRQTIEAQDTSRLITYASNHPLTDICYEFADFISINHYTGWYGSPLSHWGEFLDELLAYMKDTGNGHKPLVMSEFGAGGIFGVRELEEDVYWSENYQQDYLEYTLKLFMDHPQVNGALIWQYCDIRSGTLSCDAGIKRLLSRPRSFNNKGLLNEFRRPKMAYYTVKKFFSEK